MFRVRPSVGKAFDGKEDTIEYYFSKPGGTLLYNMGYLSKSDITKYLKEIVSSIETIFSTDSYKTVCDRYKESLRSIGRTSLGSKFRSDYSSDIIGFSMDKAYTIRTTSLSFRPAEALACEKYTFFKSIYKSTVSRVYKHDVNDFVDIVYEYLAKYAKKDLDIMAYHLDEYITKNDKGFSSRLDDKYKHLRLGTVTIECYLRTLIALEDLATELDNLY